VTLSGKTATVILYSINGDKYERTNKVSDEYALDLSKLRSDLEDVIASIKKKMDYKMEVMEGFELEEENMDIPGLEFMDEEDGMEARLKALEMGKSIMPADADVNTISEAAEKAQARDPPKRDVIFDMSEEPVYNKPNDDRYIGKDIGVDQGFGTDRQLEMKPVIIEDQLAKYFMDEEDKPPGAGMEYKPKGAYGDNQRRNTLQARERRFGSEVKERYNMNNNESELDQMESKCREITDPEQCKKTLGCYFNKKLDKCHKDLKLA
jgi:hypothetical protein